MPTCAACVGKARTACVFGRGKTASKAVPALHTSCLQETTFSGVGGAHPALFGHDLDYTEKVQCPVVLLPAQVGVGAPESHDTRLYTYNSECLG